MGFLDGQSEPSADDKLHVQSLIWTISRHSTGLPTLYQFGLLGHRASDRLRGQSSNLLPGGESMAFCAKCGAEVAPSAGFCPKCGAPQAAAAAPDPAPAPSPVVSSPPMASGETGLAENIAGLLCYVLGWVT